MKNVGLIYGGRSPEHEVSIMSARNVYQGLLDAGYSVRLIYITKDGTWQLVDSIDAHSGVEIMISPGQQHPLSIGGVALELDIIFPLVHGDNGEDGRLMGLLDMIRLPYVGCGHLASAVCMDKDVTKALLREAGVRVAPSLTLHRRQSYDVHSISETFGMPVFVKPANAGSSVGVSKVDDTHELRKAVELAFEYDDKVLIESGIIGDEVECAILGTGADIMVSVPGRVVPLIDGFYSYEGKYDGTEGARIEIPVQEYSDELIDRIKSFAQQVYEVLGCTGLARVDMFVTSAGEIYLNEVNTMPGFTNNSMYPKLMEASGVGYVELLQRLVGGQ